MNLMQFLKIRPADSLCNLRNSEEEAAEESEDDLGAVLVIPLIIFIICGKRCHCHECHSFLEGNCLEFCPSPGPEQRSRDDTGSKQSHHSTGQHPSTAFSGKGENTHGSSLVNFVSGINEKINLELIAVLSCEHNNSGNPPNIWKILAKAEGSACLSQAIHTNSGHNYIYVFFGSTLFFPQPQREILRRPPVMQKPCGKGGCKIPIAWCHAVIPRSTPGTTEQCGSRCDHMCALF